MTYILRLLVTLLPISLIGCSYVSSATGIQSRDKDYLAARSIPPLKIPPGISSSSFHAYYPVSDKLYAGSAQQVNLTPPGLDD